MFKKDIKHLTKENTDYRQVLWTGDFAQVVLMSIPSGEEIGYEKHSVDQILFLVEGEGEVVINGETQQFRTHDMVFVPAGVVHNFKNTGSEYMKLYTIYSPPNHPAGLVQHEKPRKKAEVSGSNEELVYFDPLEYM